MAGFRNVAAWASAIDAGKTHVSTFRKTVASSATAANDFVDYTYFAGNPPANFYASAPLEAAYVENIRSIYVPTMANGETQWLKSITGMSAASSATSTTNQNQRHLLADYLMYYPFVDTDAVGEQQDMVQTVSLPRYNTAAVFGPELVTNGTFDDGTSWGPPAGWSIGSGVLTKSSNTLNPVANVGQVVAGKQYQCTFYITAETTAGAGVSIRIGGTIGGFRTGVGAKTEIITAGTNGSIEIIARGASGDWIGTIDNISVREVISQGQGQGGQIMCVAQSASSTVGTFTVSYTNQDGIAGRTSQVTYTKVVAGGGILVSSPTNSVAGSLPFVGLQAGDTGVRSIESVTFSAAGGGLMALVIVQPLFNWYTTEECRRTTATVFDSFGSATYFETVLMRQPVEIKNGAVLGNIGLGNAGSLASSILVGTLQTVWG